MSGGADATTTGGWAAVPSDDGEYYYNSLSGETSWDKPIELGGDGGVAAAAAAAAADAPALDDEAAATAPDGALLAEGWVAVATEDGETYYHNEATGETAWEPPYAESAAYAEGAENGADLFRSVLGGGDADAAASEDPYAWTRTEDPGSGVPYWYREATGETSWNDPNAAAEYDGSADAYDGATYAAAPAALERPPVAEGSIALVELTVEQVAALLRFHKLDPLVAGFMGEAVDGGMLNDMETLEDMDEIVSKLKVRKKKLLRVLENARAEGVTLASLAQGTATSAAVSAAAASELKARQQHGAPPPSPGAEPPAIVRTAPPPEGACLIGGVPCARTNVLVPTAGPLGLELCTVLLLKCKRVLVEVKNVKPGSVMESFGVARDDWVEIIDGINVDILGSLDGDGDGRLSLEEIEHVRGRIDELGAAAGNRGPQRTHLPSATALLEKYDTDHDGTLDLSEIYNLIDGPLMSRVVGLLGTRPLALSFVRRDVEADAAQEAQAAAELKALHDAYKAAADDGI